MNNKTYENLKKEVKEIKEMPKMFLFLDDINRFCRKNDKALSDGMITQKQHDKLEKTIHDIWWGR